MAHCSFCGEPAGLFHKVHPTCERAHTEGLQKIPQLCERYLERRDTPESFYNRLVEIAKITHVPDEDLRQLVLDGIARLINHTQENRILTEEDQNRICDFYGLFHFSNKTLTLAEIPQKMMMHLCLRSLDNGPIVNNPLNVKTSILLRKNEIIVWVFETVVHYIITDETSYVGGSQGISVRLAKGFYYQLGAFKGHKVAVPKSEFDMGQLVITNKAIFYEGLDGTRTFRVELRDIIALESYFDGVKITTRGTRSKPLIFQFDDAWFATNLLSHLSQL